MADVQGSKGGYPRRVTIDSVVRETLERTCITRFHVRVKYYVDSHGRRVSDS